MSLKSEVLWVSHTPYLGVRGDTGPGLRTGQTQRGRPPSNWFDRMISCHVVFQRFHARKLVRPFHSDVTPVGPVPSAKRQQNLDREQSVSRETTTSGAEITGPSKIVPVGGDGRRHREVLGNILGRGRTRGGPLRRRGRPTGTPAVPGSEEGERVLRRSLAADQLPTALVGRGDPVPRVSGRAAPQGVCTPEGMRQKVLCLALVLGGIL